MFNKFENIEKTAGVNPMTQYTKDLLEKRLIDLQEELKKHQHDSGEAIDKGDEYHDNFAFEEASRLVDMTSIQIAKTKDKIKNAFIIEPNQHTDLVNLGNRVVVRFDGENEDEIFTILGPDDAAQKSGWISYKTPLGMRLMGKKAGDHIEYEVDKNRTKFRVIVKSILPGNF